MLANWQTLRSAGSFLPWSPLPPWQSSGAANNCPVMRLFQFPILTVMVLTLASVEKGNDIQTHEVGRLGLLMTPSFGILFFACVYSALSSSCILHNKIIYLSAVFCLSVLHSYAREKKEERAFSFVHVAVLPVCPACCHQRYFTRKVRGLSSCQQPVNTWRSCDFHCSFWFVSPSLGRNYACKTT